MANSLFQFLQELALMLPECWTDYGRKGVPEEVSKVLAFISPFTNNGAKLEEVKERADAEEIYVMNADCWRELDHKQKMIGR